MARLMSMLIGLALLLAVAMGCTPEPTLPPSPAPISQEESQAIAQKFVTGDPTYVFDGIASTLKLTGTEALRTPYSWQFTFQFDSAHAGYGERIGQVLAQVITPHTAVISVTEGKVSRAVMDGKWDMLKQQLIAAMQPVTPGLILDENYDGKQVDVKAGSQLTVALESNASTGFKWELKGISDETVLRLLENGAEPPGELIPGNAGTETWTFGALKSGTATLKLEYSRPWIGGEKAVRTFTLTVKVS